MMELHGRPPEGVADVAMKANDVLVLRSVAPALTVAYWRKLRMVP